MGLRNPELLYVHRYAVGTGTTWLFRGRVVVCVGDDDIPRGYVEVTGPEDGPTGNLIPFHMLVVVTNNEGPPREIDEAEHHFFANVFIRAEEWDDYWFSQQTSLEILKAYRMGYEAREKNAGLINPMPMGGPDENLLLFAWQLGYDRHARMEYWQQLRDAWKNPGA